MPKRKCTFNDNLKAKYPFIKQTNTPSNVRCEKCRTEFSVSHSGAGDIEHHLKSEKHKNADRAAASSSSMLNFFKKSSVPTSKDLDIAAAEGVWAYHTIQENHSFRSNDCASKLIQSCFDQKFRCARTKTEAIVVNILAQTAIKELKDDLGIAKFNNKYKNVGGINCPKRIECISTTGKTKLQLVKGQDDLRQDAVMQQVFNIMTDVLASNKQTKNMLIRTYKVVPLSMRSGVLEWVANSMPIGSYLVGSKEENYVGAHRDFRPDNWTPGQCRTKYKAASNSSNEEKLRIFNEICENFKPVFHKFFETHFPQPSVWYERRKAYIHSVATTSMCGYILGIGDRHVSNILIDKQSAELIHIDFGIAFEQGKCLPTPETIPFRLTRDIVDGMGVSGVEGLFRKSCEKTMEVLRTNSQTILTILEVLLYDPLYFWTVTPAEAHKRQTEENMNKTNSDDSEDETKNISAETALLRLRGKLQGTEEGRPTTVEQQVGMLIQQAMAPANLSRLFHGWQPYL